MTDVRASLRQLFDAGIAAVNGYDATARALRELSFDEPIYLVAVGKAADAMTRGALSRHAGQVAQALVVTKHHHLSHCLNTTPGVRCLEAGHPTPDKYSLQAGQALIDFVSAVPSEARLLVLLSGGASALVEQLIDGIELADLQMLTEKLLGGGLPIGEMNAERRRVSMIKDGGLSRYLSECAVTQLLISDVPGDTLADIGSGLLLGSRVDESLQTRIETHLIASSAMAQRAVAASAQQQNFTVVQAAGELFGDIADVTNHICDTLLAPNAAAGVCIWGGEPTVKLPECAGRGGRNQHLALSLAKRLVDHPGVDILCCGTDGTDGPTEDAGGWVNHLTVSRGDALQLDIDITLAHADAGTYLQQVGGLITIGPTGTNVMDLVIAISV